jgi:nucleoid-associated protein YgaU
MGLVRGGTATETAAAAAEAAAAAAAAAAAGAAAGAAAAAADAEAAAAEAEAVAAAVAAAAAAAATATAAAAAAAASCQWLKAKSNLLPLLREQQLLWPLPQSVCPSVCPSACELRSVYLRNGIAGRPKGVVREGGTDDRRRKREDWTLWIFFLSLLLSKLINAFKSYKPLKNSTATVVNGRCSGP